MTDERVCGKCNWKNCKYEGIHEHYRKDGSLWTTLCNKHHVELEMSMDIKNPNWKPKQMLRCWVLANGGAENMIKKEAHVSLDVKQG